jgi:PTH1 family peptidyl-tRNA hydrolase
MKLIVGLGNPGKDYAGHRHNLGFRCINHLAKAHGIGVDKRQCQAQAGAGRMAGVPVVLAKPRTFMNLSGEAVRLLMQRYKAKREDLVVIHDDLDLPPGRIRLYANGGPGGHRGVASIISALGSRDFVRIRVGVGRPPPGMDPVDYVLLEFSPTERAVIEEAIARVGEAVPFMLREGLAAAMNKYNQREPALPGAPSEETPRRE